MTLRYFSLVIWELISVRHRTGGQSTVYLDDLTFLIYKKYLILFPPNKRILNHIL